MFPVKPFIERFGEALAELDVLAEASDGPEGENLEDLNAELEDALLMLSELRQGEDDWREDFSDAMETFKALAGDYRRLAGAVPGLDALSDRLASTAQMALNNLED